jgi:RNA polymerase sigma-70 factor (ECF subfamily)
MIESPVRFETLIERHHDEIYRYLWRLLRSSGRSDGGDLAEDLTQDVFTRAFGAFERLRQDSNHRAWLYKIATNCAYTALKQEKRLLSSASIDDATHRVIAGAEQSPDHQVLLGEKLEEIRRSIYGLPRKQGAAVVMRHVQELSYPEIAEALGCSQDSARANVYQGLRRLRRELHEELQGEDKWTSDN